MSRAAGKQPEIELKTSKVACTNEISKDAGYTSKKSPIKSIDCASKMAAIDGRTGKWLSRQLAALSGRDPMTFRRRRDPGGPVLSQQSQCDRPSVNWKQDLGCPAD
jgi:hypothetical protein